MYFFPVQMKVSFFKCLKLKEKKIVDTNNEMSEEELQFWNEIDKFWEVDYNEILPKRRGSHVMHFGKKNIHLYCIQLHKY